MARPEREITSPSAMEGAIREWLVEAQTKRPLIFERIPDSKMAGNYIQDAPADFYFVLSGRFAYLEAKFSQKHRSLRACFSNAVSINQTASAKLARRAGARYFLLFYSSAEERFEVWDGAYCADRRSLSKPLEEKQRLHLCISLNEVMTHILEDSWKPAI